MPLVLKPATPRLVVLVPVMLVMSGAKALIALLEAAITFSLAVDVLVVPMGRFGDAHPFGGRPVGRRRAED